MYVYILVYKCIISCITWDRAVKPGNRLSGRPGSREKEPARKSGQTTRRDIADATLRVVSLPAPPAHLPGSALPGSMLPGRLRSCRLPGHLAGPGFLGYIMG